MSTDPRTMSTATHDAPIDIELDSITDAVPSDPVERLALSRERLRLAMMPAPPRQPGADLQAAGTHRGSALERLRVIPGAAVVIDTLDDWWTRHPLRSVVLVAAAASRTAVLPIARRTPVKLVLVALAVGAAIAWMRPWRWLIRRALFAGLVPQLVSRAVASVPVESWVSLVGHATDPSRRGPTPPSKRTRESPSA